ncbi:DUF6156 family protein [Methylocystis sp. SC2]|uniref:DUF6156 family protein n=1 Tax=Methylocystis sp. (strain SC2) TaxID=187303 RepID=UPI00027AEAA2|nr:DUF6156 family protein [Methylocystis sp. SC2]CCJ06828.1 Conserved hypothetical protein [Methylocystis sp. SC2]
MSEMNEAPNVEECRYFLSCSGVRLPLKLLGPLEASELMNRNTYFRATYDAEGRIISCEKLVYGEVELRHDYAYGADGALVRARIAMGEDVSEIDCGADGVPLRS